LFFRTITVCSGQTIATRRTEEESGVQVLDGDTSRLTRGGEDLDNVGFVFFGDPDGNGWAVQQIPARD
jgi:hypothetical protein